MHPLLFLDIEGVLVSMAGREYRFVQESVQALNKIIDTTSAKTVVTSQWRYLLINEHMNLYGFNVFLRSHGVHGEVVGHTREEYAEHEARWLQIRDYLRVARLNLTEHLPFCILDDNPSAFGGDDSIGVQTNGNHLTMADADVAISLLSTGKKSKPAPPF